MADPIVDELVRNARPQPHNSTFDLSTFEKNQEEETPRAAAGIDPKLLRAIVNGDFIFFESISGTNGRIDTESPPVTNNGGNSVVRGVTCGENNALHVVAGVVIEKTSKISLGMRIGMITSLVLLYYSDIYVIFRKYWGIGLILIFLMCCDIIINRGIIFVSVHFPWIPEKIYEKAKRTRWLRWVLDLSFYKRRMYMEIAHIIYRQDPTMLYARNCAGETPLHCAANAGNLDMVSQLVEFARTEVPQKVRQLLQARNKVGETALHGAALSGYSGIVKELLCADKTVACLGDQNGISPLYLAVTSGCLNVVEQLIAAKNPATAAGNPPTNAETQAATAGNPATAAENPATAAGNPSTDAENLPSYAGPDEQNALHAAVMRQKEKGYIINLLEAMRLKKSSEKIMRVILEWNPSLAAKTDKEGNTPLHYAALIGKIYAVRELLLKDTGSAYKANKSGSFPVHLAAEAGKIKVIMELLSMCPDVGELLDKEKRNFLHVAVEKKRIRIIRWACRQGFNAGVMNAKDNDGNTPLHLAVISSESAIFTLLSDNKRVNTNIRNKAGLTPLDISASLKDHQLKYTLIPQNVIHRDLLVGGAFQNPCQPDLSKKVGNLVKARADCPNKKSYNISKGKEMCNDVEDDIEKELTDCENKSKSLTTGAVLIASATFVAIFTVSKVYSDDTSSPILLSIDNVFIAFVVADMVAFICALVSTIWLLYASLSNFLPKYRKIYFRLCTPLLYVALHLFILAFGLGSYIAIAPFNELLAYYIFLISGFSFFITTLTNPRIIFLITTIYTSVIGT